VSPGEARALAGRLAGTVRLDEPLARHTTYRIGGPAALLVQPRTVDDVATALRLAGESGIPWLALGLGSNVLVADRGFPGLVIRLGKGLDHVAQGGPEGVRWTVGAGLPTPLLARRSAQAGHAGVERLIGVPGTVGGGVAMNAGAHGQDFATVTRTVTVVEPAGELRSLPAAEIPWRYRSSGLDGVAIVEAVLELAPGDPAHTREELERYLRKRREGTPFDQPCCGSVFRNPPAEAAEGRTAGQLIEAAGLKGFRSGGAQVSPLHANYIVNLGGANAADVRAVIETVRQRVHQRFGVDLALEVKLIGF